MLTNQLLVYVICFLNLTHAFCFFLWLLFLCFFVVLFIVWVWLPLIHGNSAAACAACWPCVCAAHSPYGLAAYANVNGLDPAGGSGGGGSRQGYHHQDDHEQQEFGSMNPVGHSPNRRMAPPPPSRSTEGTYQPRPPPPVPAEAMASLNIGLDKSGPFIYLVCLLAFLPCAFSLDFYKFDF